MTNDNETFTLWTTTQKNWEGNLFGGNVTEDTLKQLPTLLSENSQLNERLQPYNTPVTEATLRQYVK